MSRAWDRSKSEKAIGCLRKEIGVVKEELETGSKDNKMKIPRRTSRDPK